MDLPETTLWWTSTTHHHQQQNTSEPPLQHYHQPTTTWYNNNFNLNNQNNDNNNNNDEEDEEVENHNDDEENNNTTNTNLEDEKEPMFEKPLTPSDVGKLNRLVIPKQHAEKYFPLGGQGVSNECKGLLLSFEDESGKCWRFRYSYWNSSQSYVLTKGWSRYVKDKRLDAGDVVFFERHRLDTQRLFINWRRRRTNGTESAHVSRDVRTGDNNRYGKNEVGSGVGWTRGFYPAHPYPAHHQFFPYQQDSLHAAGRGSQQQGERQRTKPVGKSSSSSSSSSRVLRLFGVNMECQPENHHDNDSGPSTPQCSSYYDSNNNNIIPSTQGITDTHHLYHYHQQSSSNPHPHLLRHQPYYY